MCSLEPWYAQGWIHYILYSMSHFSQLPNIECITVKATVCIIVYGLFFLSGDEMGFQANGALDNRALDRRGARPTGAID